MKGSSPILVLAALAAIFAVPGSAVGAQAKQPGSAAPARAAAASPESTAGRYVAALREADFATVARLMHPSALQQIRRLVTAVASKDGSGEVLRTLGGVGSASELAAVPDTVLFARFLANTAGANEELRQAMRDARMEVLGHIAEGADTAHVLYRVHLTVQGVPFRKVDVLSLRRSAGEWRALLTADLEGMVGALTGGSF
ncbi:MAG TPA: hypothetical protein VFS05_11040 [Gemmatimonadaceae bacterium]|nr:hypothetical protein [Gemmatimonadaceae bacterium]